MTEPPTLNSLDPERHPEATATLGLLPGSPMLTSTQAMPFKLTADQGALKSTRLPDLYTENLARTAANAAESFGGLAQLSTEDAAGRLVSYAVATGDPRTAERLKEFVERLQLDEENDD